MTKYLFGISIILSITILCAAPASSLAWSEIMFNPLGNDNGREFIELTGNESLEGCTVKDSASTDKLTLLQQGEPVILIIESNSTIPAGNATVYLAGSAIGNGLGNTADTLQISCGDAALLAMAYNISSFEGYKEGYSIIFNGSWALGTMNGTPGTVPRSDDAGTVAPRKDNGTDDGAGGDGNTDTCDDTLIIAMNATNTTAGETLTFTIDSSEYAWFEVSADRLPVASGDTLTTRTHHFIVPDAAQLRITAYAQACDAKQRAVRYVTIRPRAEAPAGAVEETTQDTLQGGTIQEMKRENASTPTQDRSPAQQGTPQYDTQTPLVPQEQHNSTAPQVTGAAVLQEDIDAVPWISAFGMVTVIASAAVFLQLLRRGEA